MICRFQHGGLCCNSGSRHYEYECRECECMIPVSNGERIRSMTDEELADVCMQRAPQFGVTADICSCGMHVFEELGLVRTRAVNNAGVSARAIHVCEFGGKVELTDSVLYREGIEDAECFAQFAQWALSSPADALRNAIIRPILPNGASGEGDIHA